MATFNEKRARLDIEDHKEGDPLGLSITFGFDITGYHDWSGQVRKAPTPTSPVLAQFAVDSVAPEPNRTVRFFLTGAQMTMALNGAGYDLQVLDANDEPHTFMDGDFDITPQYTV